VLHILIIFGRLPIAGRIRERDVTCFGNKQAFGLTQIGGNKTMTTFGALATGDVPVTPKRNRHSVENDQKTALIKRINRIYAKRGRKISVVKGKNVLTFLDTGYVVNNDVQDLPQLYQALDSLWGKSAQN
jgi:hypothetical protein